MLSEVLLLSSSEDGGIWRHRGGTPAPLEEVPGVSIQDQEGRERGRESPQSADGRQSLTIC